ncbi:GNAT family N-acetyltransferase [Brachybacterium sp. MASK1Z-5]|uniref:GNAT family N-acetyltransferase n=1 Tax=Brachybacterium halotolerans TaxID=2795215 RepID=A0ABS1B5U2_9MICO|nr:N-acetyltransferase [Brachybacterium halotolerans]MBK0330005.1 GNAT family N-acetyltransferase [Brachybacterium halotolerans]
MTATSEIDHLTWDTLRLEDVEQLRSLMNAIGEADGTGETISLASTREFLGTPGTDLDRESIAVREGDRLIAYGCVDVAAQPDREGRARCRLPGGVHPSRRGRGIGGRILDAQQEIAESLAAAEHPGRAGHMHVGGGLEGADVRPLLTARGFAPVRSFLEMLRELPGEQVAPSPSIAGVDLRTPGDADAEPVHAAHVAAFADHWGSAPSSPERWAHMWSASTRRPEFSSIAMDGEGRVLAYVMTDVWEDRRLYIALVGTRPEARGRGIGTAVLTRTLRLAAASGEFDDVQLEVDGASLTGAGRLYERLGFTRDKEFTLYSKDLQKEAV